MALRSARRLSVGALRVRHAAAAGARRAGPDPDRNRAVRPRHDVPSRPRAAEIRSGAVVALFVARPDVLGIVARACHDAPAAAGRAPALSGSGSNDPYRAGIRLLSTVFR